MSNLQENYINPFDNESLSFQVLRNHADLISALEEGPIKVRSTAGAEQSVTISGGVVEVLDNKITVLAESVIED